MRTFAVDLLKQNVLCKDENSICFIHEIQTYTR
jgi:hypothetical protein